MDRKRSGIGRPGRRQTPGDPRRARVFAVALAVAALLPPTVIAAAPQAEVWPAAVQARYRLRYNGLEVGKLNVSSQVTANGYAVSGSGKVSVLMGVFAWWGGAAVSGVIAGNAPAPAGYSFEWHQKKKKDVFIKLGYKDRMAAGVEVNPPPKSHSDTVPLTRAHLPGAVDPLSAIMMLTKADGGPPCERRAPVFDGTQRYDIVFTPKRTTQLPPLSGRGAPETAPVCRVTYEPVAGHRANEDTKAYAANRDVELVLRRIPGTGMYFPYSLAIPTAWGTGTMVADRIEIVTAGAGKVAFTP